MSFLLNRQVLLNDIRTMEHKVIMSSNKSALEREQDINELRYWKQTLNDSSTFSEDDQELLQSQVSECLQELSNWY